MWNIIQKWCIFQHALVDETGLYSNKAFPAVAL